jgi:menaquinone-specific isochorismate synthase
VIISVYDKIASSIEEGILQSRTRNKPILVSQVIPMEARGARSFYLSDYAQATKHRFIWSTPTHDFTCVGLGATTILLTSNDNRFQDIEVQWTSILKDALVIPPFVQQGTGPLLFGGFSFDPERIKESHWHRFGDGLFILPRYMYSKIEDGAWLTINFMVSAEDSIALLSRQIEVELALLNKNTQMHKSANGKVRLHCVPDSVADWSTRVDQVSQEIENGTIEKVVLARELVVRTDDDFDIEKILDRLDDENENTYRFAIQIEGDCFIGATPERLIKQDQDYLYSSCLAGSAPRGHTTAEDELIGQVLMQDPKNLHEHEVVLRIVKEIMEIGCSNIHAPSWPVLYKGKYIQHLYTPVTGESNHQASLLRMVENLHPTPALGGYPRDRALQLIRQVETFDRGWYASPLGWIDHQGQGEFVIGIRSALIQGNKAYLYAGCGIVNQSIPLHEFEETAIKFKTMLSVLGGD